MSAFLKPFVLVAHLVAISSCAHSVPEQSTLTQQQCPSLPSSAVGNQMERPNLDPSGALDAEGIMPRRLRARLPSADSPLVHQKMRAHGRDMTDLLWAVLLLDHASVQRIAERIVSTEKREPLASGKMSQLYPPEFFRLRGQVVNSADRLARAAKEQDPKLMEVNFARLNQTCVSCHSRFTERWQTGRLPSQIRDPAELR